MGGGGAWGSSSLVRSTVSLFALTFDEDPRDCCCSCSFPFPLILPSSSKYSPIVPRPHASFNSTNSRFIQSCSKSPSSSRLTGTRYLPPPTSTFFSFSSESPVPSLSLLPLSSLTSSSSTFSAFCPSSLLTAAAALNSLPRALCAIRGAAFDFFPFSRTLLVSSSAPTFSPSPSPNFRSLRRCWRSA